MLLRQLDVGTIKRNEPVNGTVVAAATVEDADVGGIDPALSSRGSERLGTEPVEWAALGGGGGGCCFLLRFFAHVLINRQASS